MQWPRRIVAGLSPQRPGFVPGIESGLVHVEFCGGQSDTGTDFSQSFSVLPCHGGLKKVPLVTAVQGHSLTPLTRKATSYIYSTLKQALRQKS